MMYKNYEAASFIDVGNLKWSFLNQRRKKVVFLQKYVHLRKMASESLLEKEYHIRLRSGKRC